MPAAFAPWTTADFALNMAIWWAMMPGMMLPSAAPMILVFAAINRHKRQRGQPFVPTMLFTSGYLIAWGLFGLFATLADWGLERTRRADIAGYGTARADTGRDRRDRGRHLPADATKIRLLDALSIAL